MAAMLFALRECRDVLPDLSHEIWFAGLMGEEAGQQGAKALSATEKFDFAIVGEPTQLQIVNAHKGVIVAEASGARPCRARFHAADWPKCDRENGRGARGSAR